MNFKISILILSFGVMIFGQDSLKINELEEIVVTSQFEPQSLKRSVHHVRVINQKDFKNLAAVHLGDVLNQYLNITVIPSGRDGRTTVSMFGLDAQYFKILIDNVPIVNESGLGNNTDLSQINLNDIERIEIIEGSMGVTHGANAVSGILNIITKKKLQNKWELNASIQEETVGKEYEWFERGRHIQNFKIGHQLNDQLTLTWGTNRNDFRGFYGERLGKNHNENNGLRGPRWLPKEQLNHQGLISYNKNKTKIFYKFELLDEEIQFYNDIVQSGFNNNLGAFKFGEDRRFFTKRNFHHLNANGQFLEKINYNLSFSYQNQTREIENYRYNITNRNETNNQKQKDQGMEVLYALGNFSNFIKNKKYDFQLGYELVQNNGLSIVDGSENTKKTISKKINNFDVFGVGEWAISDKLSLRTGGRYSIQNYFKNQYAYSLAGRVLLKNDWELRSAYNRSYRTPNFQELFTEIIFTGHFFVGNENLFPEQSQSFEASVKKATILNENLKINAQLIFHYMTIKDRIDVALIGFDQSSNTPMYQYININQYQMWNVSTMHQVSWHNFQANFGLTVVGISRALDNGRNQLNNKFLYNYNLNFNASYFFKKIETTLAAYYKYTGETQQFITANEGFVLSEIEPYHWLDTSIQKQFFNKKLEVSLGARNLFNITDINQSNTNQGAHAGGSQILLAYGTSYFLRLNYAFNL